MPKARRDPTPERGPILGDWTTRILALVAVVTVLGAVALYGVQAGWFGSEDEGIQNPEQHVLVGSDETPAPETDAFRLRAVAMADWGAPAPPVPTVGVGTAVSDSSPSTTTLKVENGRAVVGVRVPNVRENGAEYSAYTLELRSGVQRLWGTLLPKSDQKNVDTFTLSLNAEALEQAGVASNPLTIQVTGTATTDRSRKKNDRLGLAQVTLEKTQ